MRTATRILIVCGAVLCVGALVPAPASAANEARTPISHFIFLMQGERSFDNYFGTFPGADGPPTEACVPFVLGRPASGCVTPFALHGKAVTQFSASQSVLENQINGGRMDGFVDAFRKQGRDGTSTMGYYDERDLAFYWDVARQYVLFDRFFSAAPYGIRLNRSYWVSGAPPPGGSATVPAGGYGSAPTIFDRLEKAGVSWKFYVQNYDPNETFRAASATDPATQTARVPLLNYSRFVDDPALRGHIVDLDEYYRDLEQGTLPAVAYVASSGANERADGSIDAGQRLVRSMVTELMLSRYWENSAFMWSYDGGGGWYDHVPPPSIDGKQAGMRVPALLVSPYARRGEVDHTQLDYTSALRFIEENWGVPPLTSRDASAKSVASAFDFAAPPRPARIIQVGQPPATPKASNPAIIYGFYGGAVLFALLLLGFAAKGSALIAARRRAPVVTDATTKVPVS